MNLGSVETTAALGIGTDASPRALSSALAARKGRAERISPEVDRFCFSSVASDGPAPRSPAFFQRFLDREERRAGGHKEIGASRRVLHGQSRRTGGHGADSGPQRLLSYSTASCRPTARARATIRCGRSVIQFHFLDSLDAPAIGTNSTLWYVRREHLTPE